MPYLTPGTLPADTICRVLFIPNTLDWLAQVTGALQELTFEYNWEQYGAVTPGQAAEAMRTMFDLFCFDEGVCRVIGELICYAGDISPDVKWLVCDGSSLLRTDYPDLFNVIGTAYGAVDGTHFNLPDLRGRVPLGVGNGPGLSSYIIGDNGGEESHTLTLTETPTHSHIDSGHTHGESTAVPSVGAAITGVPVPSATPGIGVTGAGSAVLSNSGSGGAHNNLQPYLAVNYLIVALA